jgi:hypothetical protein
VPGFSGLLCIPRIIPRIARSPSSTLVTETALNRRITRYCEDRGLSPGLHWEFFIITILRQTKNQARRFRRVCLAAVIAVQAQPQH